MLRLRDIQRRFDRAAVGRLLGRFRRLLERMASGAVSRLAKAPSMGRAERHQQLVEWNESGTGSGGATSLARLVGGQVDRRPHAIAVCCPRAATGDLQLSYLELDLRADRLARTLAARGGGPEGGVALDLAPSIEMLIGVLAVVKAGGVCLPLDRRYPKRRLALILEDARAAWLLTERARAGELPATGAEVILLDSDVTARGLATGSGPGPAGPENLAYVVYTSGSTGRPKGVAMRQRSLVELVSWHLRQPGLGSERRTLRFAAPGFDVLFQEIFVTWCSGGTLVAIPDELRRDAVLLSRLIERLAVERIFLPPVALRQLAEVAFEREAAAGRPLELIAAGEQLKLTAAIKAFFASRPGSRLHNHYGPSETHVVTAQQVATAPSAESTPPIGKPIDASRVFILDAELRPVPTGAAGELLVAGASLARGYLGRPARTAGSFVPDPFARRAGGRLYRTGDLGRFLADGAIEFLGRIDYQLKVRGYRVEPQEVEAVLERHPGVRSAAVTFLHPPPHQLGGGTGGHPAGAVSQLVALVVPAGAGAPGEPGVAPTAGELSAFATARLPEFMVPAAFSFLEALPLTPSGKLDRRALSRRWSARAEWVRPERSTSANGPRSPIEEILTEIWGRLLGVSEVGVHDNFFALGGHSLVLTQVASRIRRSFGVELPLAVLFDRPTVAKLATDLETALKSQLGRAEAPDAVPPLDRTRRTQPPPLSFAQQRLWLVHQLEPAGSAYALPEALRLQGELRPAVLSGSFRELLRRHEILRTTFDQDGPTGEAYQVIAPDAEVALPLVDLRNMSPSEGRSVARRLAAEEAGRAFDLARGPLLRLLLMRLQEHEHMLIVNQHHIVSDGWSRSIFFRELAALYGAFAAGRHSPLPELQIQYADFAIWQRRCLTRERASALLDYWRGQLDGAGPLRLAADRSPPAGQSAADSRAGSLGLELPAELAAALGRLGLEAGASLFMTLLSIFMALLARHSGQWDLTVGTPVAGRGHRKIEDLLGFFVNMLPLRGRLVPGARFVEVLEQVREVALGAYCHQDLPFDLMVEELDPERSKGTHPLFQVVLGLHVEPHPDVVVPGLAMRPIELFPPSTRFDLELHLWEERDGRLAGTFDYRADLFDPTTIRRLAGHLIQLAHAVAARPRRRLSELPMLSRAQRHQLLVEWNDRRTSFPRESCLHRLFETWARRTPDAIAVVFDSGASRVSALSYRPLDRRADRLARRLRAEGVGPESNVGLFFERSPELIISMLAILKAGGAYVPLDPASPPDRLAFVAKAAGLRSVVARRSEWLLQALGTPAVLLGQWRQTAGTPAAETAAAETAAAGTPAAENLAYVIYTSGSTGRPKGVAVDHRAVARLVLNTDYVRLRPSDRVAQMSNPAFDAATFEIWGALLNGAQLVVIPSEVALEPRRLTTAIRHHRTSALFLTTALFNAVILEDPAAFRTVRHLLFGGEAVAPERVRESLAGGPPRRLLHVYGPTESTTFTTWHRVREVARADSTVPIGQPIGSTIVHVLDGGLRPAPAGVKGELCIGGEGLARGYAGRPRLTAERFVPDPLAGEPGERLYLSGDLVRRRPCGDLEFLGRLDHQVKIRGFRVELGEIEAICGRHPAVRQVLVTYQQLRSGSDRRYLVAFVVPAPGAAQSYVGAAQRGGPSAGELRGYLANRLPNYMVPALFVFLDALPVAERGKIDRVALARLARAADPRLEMVSDYVAPGNEIEEILAGIWERLLEIGHLGACDNFFELGGHSLLATRVVSRIRQAFEIELGLDVLFEKPTVAELARYLEAAMASPAGRAPISPAPISRAARHEGPLSFAQERLWFLHQLEPGSPAYNVPWALRLEGALDQAALESSFHEIVQRHRILRTTFPDSGGTPRLRSIPKSEVSGPTMGRVDLTDLEAGAKEALARRLAAQIAARPFDLARGPSIRLMLIQLGARRHVLVCVMHHIVTDDWSFAVIARELRAFYETFTRHRPSPLPKLQVQYADFARWQRVELSGEILRSELAYWRQRLDGVEPLELPTDRPRSQVRGHLAACRDFELGGDLTAALKKLSTGAGASLYMTLLAAFLALMNRLTGQHDIAVGSPIANRNRHEIEGLIGFFVNMLAMRGDLSRAPAFLDLLLRLRRVALEAYAHQDLPFAKLVEELEPERDMSRNPLFQVSFALQNAPESELELPALRVTPLELEPGAVRFDLEAHFWEARGGLSASLVYRADLFDGTTIARMVQRLTTLLGSIVSSPDKSLASLSQLSAAERHQLRAEWNDTRTRATAGRCLHQLFDAQARRTPDATAITFRRSTGRRSIGRDERLSYRQLDRRASDLAGHLRFLGVGPESRVGVCLDRGPRLVIALLAVLKAGGAFLSLDPDDPPARRLFMLEDSGVRVLLTGRSARRSLDGFQGPVVTLRPGGQAAGAGTRPGKAPASPARVLPRHPAYVIYTSGTTGAPKGVVVTHHGIVNHMLWMRAALPFDASDRVLQKTPIGFDAALCELWASLLSGSQLILARPGGHRDAGYMAGAIRQLGVTMLHVVPHQLGLLLDEPEFEQCRTLKRVDCGGEALGTELADRFVASGPPAELVNVYGPTETTIHAAFGNRLPGDRQRTVTIGRPIANVRVHLLNEGLHQAPIGTVGRLWVGGAGLARGYLDRPAETAERFVPDPLAGGPGRRLYDTGDLARQLPDGRLLFLERADHQLKLRGLRIEPGEIEALLARHPAVARAAVVAAEHAPEDHRLAAFIVTSHKKRANVTSQPGRESEVGEIRDSLKHRLPAAMVPSRLLWLEQMPLTASGKVDRALLKRAAAASEPPPGLELLSGSHSRSDLPAAVPPRMPAEQMLAEIWAHVLGGGDAVGGDAVGGGAAIGAHDNFFELGGHSLLATQVISRIRRLFGLELPLRTLFERPTLAELAAGLETARAGVEHSPEAVLIPRLSDRLPTSGRTGAAGGGPLSFAQERLWFLNQLEPESSAYNMASAWRLEGHLDAPDPWYEAWRARRGRHPSTNVMVTR